MATTKTKPRPTSSSRVVVKVKPRSAPSAARVVVAKAKARPVAIMGERESLAELLLTPPLTLEDHLVRIRALGDRVRECVQFMCGVDKMDGTCAEAKQRSVAMFYDRLLILDRELCRIQEELQLG